LIIVGAASIGAASSKLREMAFGQGGHFGAG
jgi:hypothetical protein